MKTIYAVAPLAGLLLFGSFYWKHARLHAQREAEQEQRELLARQEKSARLHRERELATAQAKITLARRQQERAEKEQEAEARRAARAALEQRRTVALEQTRKLRPQLDRLRLEIESVTAAVARAEDHARELRLEQAFLTDYVRQAEANRQTHYEILERLEAAERARTASPASPPATRPHRS